MKIWALPKIQNSLGFNTIELMIGLSILAAVVMAGATLNQVADRSTQYADRKQEFQALSQMIMEHLKNGESCISALRGQTVGGANLHPSGRGNGNHYGQSNSSKILGNNQERQIAIEIDGLQVGPEMNSNVLDPTAADPLQRQILPRRLQINSLSFSDAKLLNNDGTFSQFLVGVNLQADEIGGISFKKQMIGLTTINVRNSNSEIISCEAMPADAMKRVCESDAGMGCVWDPNSQPNCRCLRSQVLCAAPGYYPVSFENGIPNCRPLGGKNCPAGEFLVGVGIDQVICAPVPTSCPAGSSLNGAGNPIAGLANCKCDVAGQTYVAGAGCAGAITSNPTCGTVTRGDVSVCITGKCDNEISGPLESAASTTYGAGEPQVANASCSGEVVIDGVSRTFDFRCDPSPSNPNECFATATIPGTLNTVSISNGISSSGGSLREYATCEVNPDCSSGSTGGGTSDPGGAGTGGTTGACVPTPGFCCIGYPHNIPMRTGQMGGGNYTCTAIDGPVQVPVGSEVTLRAGYCNGPTTPCYGELIIRCAGDSNPVNVDSYCEGGIPQ